MFVVNGHCVVVEFHANLVLSRVLCRLGRVGITVSRHDHTARSSVGTPNSPPPTYFTAHLVPLNSMLNDSGRSIHRVSKNAPTMKRYNSKL